MAWPSYFIFNYNPNPSVEVSTTGYTGIVGTEQLAQTTQLAYSGSSSLSVTTAGARPGEGVSTPVGNIQASATGSAFVYIYGETGSLTIQAMQNPGGQILASTQVVLDGQNWQRVELDNLALVNGNQFQLLIWTTTAQAITFNIDAVQYEPVSPAHTYVDGNSRYGTWSGTPGLSTSYQQYQNPTGASGVMSMTGTINVVVAGQIFQVGAVAGGMDMSGTYHHMTAVTSSRTVIAPAIDTGITGQPWQIAGYGSIAITVVVPGSAFANFSVYQTGVDPDPAMTLIGWNNAGTLNAGQGATAYNQIFGAFSPPQQSLDSAGNARWQAAAYMAAGFQVANQAVYVSSSSPNAVNFAQVQVEKQTQQAPTAYQLPRSLLTTVKPTRLNYVTNPSFEVSLAGWTAIGGATLTLMTNGGVQGNNYLQVSVPSAGGGAYITVPDLIFGDTFIASAYVLPASSNISDVALSMGGQTGHANQTEYPYGNGSYGGGSYGGVDSATEAMDTSVTYRPFTSFAAPASIGTLSLIPTAITGATYPLVFYVDCVLVEPGEVLLPYGDGSTSEWEWELGQTPGLSRSYFYERQDTGANAVVQVLANHIPLGLTAYAPLFGLPPTQ